MSTHTLILRPHSLSSDAGRFEVRSGQTVRAMLQEAAGSAELSPDLYVRVGGHVVPEAYWDRLRPKPGTAIHVVRDSVAGGGDAWKQVLGAVILIAVSVWTAGAGSALAGGSTFFGSATGTVFGLSGTAAYAAVAAVSVLTPLILPALTELPA